MIRLLGSGRTKELIFTGRRIGAEEAESIALVEKIGTMEDALDIARTIAGNAPLAVRAAKKVLQEAHDLPLDEALRLETSLYRTIIATKDRAEGLAAFKEKRAPVYRGE